MVLKIGTGSHLGVKVSDRLQLRAMKYLPGISSIPLHSLKGAGNEWGA